MGDNATQLASDSGNHYPANDDGCAVVGLRSLPTGPRLSEVLYGIRWEEHLPRMLGDTGVTLSIGTWQVASHFISEHHAEVFGENDQFFRSPSNSARDRYMQQVADIFLLEHQGRVVGTHICNPVDWSTYYYRHTLILPEYQGRRLAPLLAAGLRPALVSAGVERVEADTSPSNWPMLNVFARTGFILGGTLLSERWGAQCRFVCHLERDSREVFERHYCPAAERHAEARRVR